MIRGSGLRNPGAVLQTPDPHQDVRFQVSLLNQTSVKKILEIGHIFPDPEVKRPDRGDPKRSD